MMKTNKKNKQKKQKENEGSAKWSFLFWIEINEIKKKYNKQIIKTSIFYTQYIPIIPLIMMTCFHVIDDHDDDDDENNNKTKQLNSITLIK